MEKALFELAFYAFLTYAAFKILVWLSKILMVGLLCFAVLYFVFNLAEEPIYDHKTTVEVENPKDSRVLTTISNPSLQDKICGDWRDTIANVDYHFLPNRKFKIGNLDGSWYLRSPDSPNMILDFHGVKVQYQVEATDSAMILHLPTSKLKPIIRLQKARDTL